MIHDGSSFALKAALSTTFPGRFTTIEPAAVEIHATYSGFADEITRVPVAPDAQAERPFLPDPATLTQQLRLADRGYPSVAYFEAVAAHGGACIVRLTRSDDPSVAAAWVEGQRVPVSTPIRLSRFLAEHPRQRLDLDVDFRRGRRSVRCRVVVLPGREPARTRLCTNLPRTPFTLDLVARLYRFRWPIGASCEGRMNQSVKVRPGSRDSRPRSSGGTVAREQDGEALRQQTLKGGCATLQVAA